MTAVATPRDESLKADGFKAARMLTLQPEMHPSDLSEDVLETEDPVLLHHAENLLCLWAATRNDLPQDFLDYLEVKRLRRQPLMLTTVTIQHVSRHLTEGYEPSNGENVDRQPWPTEDLLKIASLENMAFPDRQINSEQRLDGNEDVHVCPECSGERGHECSNCNGAGQIACPICSGSKHQTCPQCNGSGTVLGVSGRMIQCRACDTRGTRRCTTCDKDGMVSCDVCHSSGIITCKTCSGLGQQKRYWNLHTLIQTRSRQNTRMKESWPLKTDTLLANSQVIWETQIEWPSVQNCRNLLTTAMPAEVADVAQTAITEALAAQPITQAQSAADSGLRLRILGTYLYHIEFEYQGFKGAIFVGGNTNCVFPHRIPSPKKGLFSRIKRWIMTVLAVLDPNLRSQVDHSYVKSVQSGKSHISDSLGLGPELATNYGIKAAVTPTGYQFTIPDTARINKQLSSVSLDVNFEVDSKHALMLALNYRLGPAHRDLFPKALAMNHKIPFGRIALIQSDDGSEEFFHFVDRRPYATAQAIHYYMILREIEYSIGQILATEGFDSELTTV